MRVPKNSTSHSDHIKIAKSFVDFGHNDSFNEDSPSKYDNDALAQTMIVDTCDFSDCINTPSFMSLCSSPRHSSFTVSPQSSVAICPNNSKVTKNNKKGNTIKSSYWKVPAALGLLALVFLSKRH